MDETEPQTSGELSREMRVAVREDRTSAAARIARAAQDCEVASQEPKEDEELMLFLQTGGTPAAASVASRQSPEHAFALSQPPLTQHAQQSPVVAVARVKWLTQLSEDLMLSIPCNAEPATTVPLNQHKAKRNKSIFSPRSPMLARQRPNSCTFAIVYVKVFESGCETGV